MSEKSIVILANSIRAGKYCVAGKEIVERSDGQWDVGPWIRFTDPNDAQGAVSCASTICNVDGSRRVVRPLDIVKATFTGPCGNPNHPEDWFFDPKQRWQIIGTAERKELRALQDAPDALWHQAEADAVPAGYVRSMLPNPASLYLIKAPATWTFRYHKEWSSFKGYDRRRRRLQLNFAGRWHEFAVTDPEFDRRFKLPGATSDWPDSPQTLSVPNPKDFFFCLSLTPEFSQRHYKICATIFEP